jgi:hypothetical protein
MPNHLNCYVICIVVTQFTNVASGRIILPGGPLVGNPYSSSIEFGGDDKDTIIVRRLMIKLYYCER